jgi:DNA-binding winged helix-turn-helix (wHTH) protein/TolB-like protein/Flp pilus assembly protein TadD
MTSVEVFRLGDWLVQPSLNRISRGYVTAALQPRFMDLLVYLSEHAGKVVSKEEILDAVWAKEFVSEGTLTHAVAAIRQTLGDDVRSPQYIETIPTRGYRVIAPVTPADEAEPAAAAPVRVPPPRPATRGRRTLALTLVSIAAVVALAAAGWGVLRWISASHATSSGGVAKRIVVLPFQNLGPAARDFIASGITDDITTRLAGTHAVGVVSRTSAIYCAKAGKSVRQISEELGADYVLEGTVRQESGRPSDSQVRVNAQLIRASDDTSLWVGSFGSDVADVIDVGAAIAGRVIQELGVTVGKPELSRLESRPTGNPNAYQAYLCGIRYRDLVSREQLGLAVAMFERAVTLDPSFALAWAELTVAHARLYHLRFDDTPERLARAKQAADRAFLLGPELPETHLAMGALYHLGRREYGRALDEYSIAARDLPNDSALFALIADVHRRQGKWSEARAEIERVVNLDPQNYTALLALGDTLHPLREYEGADRAFQKAANLNPDRNDPYLRRFWNLLAWDGTTDRAERVLLEVPLPNEPELIFARSYLRYLKRDFRGALDVISAAPSDTPMGPYRFAAKPLTQCLYADALGDRAGVERACGAALELLLSVVHKRPDDARPLLELGQAHALLGHRTESVRFAEKAIGLFPVGTDACDGPGYVLLQARILARAGEARRAIETITRLLAVPSPLSAPWLRFDPCWDRLRGEPGFEALLDRTPVHTA